MLRWALRSLLAERLAFLAGTAAAGSALLLVMFYEAVWAGEGEQIIAYPRNAGADVWVMQRGVENMHMATSYLSDWKVNEVRAVPGVAGVEPILYVNTVVEANGQQWFAYVIGLEPGASQSGPWSMVAGRDDPDSGEAVVPALLASMAGLDLGDRIRIIDKEFSIAGLSDETFSMSNSVIFVPRLDVEDILSAFDIVSFMLVTGEEGVSSEALARAIEMDVDNVSALPAEVFLHNDRQLAMQMGVETVALMTMICGALAVLLVAFTVYSQIVRQRREYAVAKALGATHKSLYLSVALQSTILALASASFAGLAAWFLMPMVARLAPVISLDLTMTSVLRIGAASVLVALIASVLPARRLARVDPATAFHG